MSPYPVENLVPRDLVVVEAHVTRFKLKQPGADKKPAAWIDWRAQLELHSISLLGKSAAVIEPEESNVYI